MSYRHDLAEATPDVRHRLERRAALLREKAKAAEETAVVALAEFNVGRDACAVPLACLRACVPLKGVTAVPMSPRGVVGVVRFQAQVIPVFSLSAALGDGGWQSDPSVLLVLEVSGRLIAIDSEEVPKPTTWPAQLIEESRTRSGAGLVAEITAPDMRLVRLIDPVLLLRVR